MFFLKGIGTENEQHLDNELKPGEEVKILRWKEQHPIVAETSIGRRFLNTAGYKTDLHVFADASEDTMCAVAYVRNQQNSAALAFVIEKLRVVPNRTSFSATIGIESGSHGSEVERIDIRGTRNGDKELRIFDRLN